MIPCPKKNLTRGKDPSLCALRVSRIVKERNKTKHSIKNTPRERGIFVFVQLFACCYNDLMEVKRLGVIRGGKDHYETSIREGAELISHILSHLSSSWKAVDIFIDREGRWHAGGLPVKPENVFGKADIFWDTTRSDAYVTLTDAPIAHVSGGFSSFSHESRDMLAEHLKDKGIKIPRHIFLPAYQKDFDGPIETYAVRKAREVLEKFPPPWRMRLFPGDPRAGALLVKTLPELVNAIIDGSEYGGSVLVEEFVGGKNFSAHSVLGFRGKDVYIFPTDERIAVLARNLHEYVPAAYYVNASFVVHPKNGAYLSDMEFSPDWTQDSAFTESCEKVGTKTHQVLLHILDKAFARK